MTEYGYSVEVPEGYDEAVVRARLALRSEGFSILTEMHVGGLLGPEAVPGRQYLIMGVFDPRVSSSRIDGDLQVSVHLPCNIVVQESGAGAIVAALDPVDVVETQDPSVEQTAKAAREALERVLQRVTMAP